MKLSKISSFEQEEVYKKYTSLKKFDIHIKGKSIELLYLYCPGLNIFKELEK